MSGEKERSPLHNTTPIVKQARTAFLAMILVSVAVLVAVLFRDDTIESNAVAQAKTAQGLVSYWRRVVQGKYETDITSLLYGVTGTNAEKKFVYRVIANAPQQIAGLPKEVKCDASFRIPAKLMVNERSVPISPSARSVPPDGPIFQDMLETSSRWHVLKSTPANLDEFTNIWNYLYINKAAASITSFSVEKAIIISSVSVSGQGKPFRVTDFSELEVQEPVAYQKFGIGRFLPREFTGTQDIEDSQFDTDVVNRWKSEGYEFAILGTCRSRDKDFANRIIEQSIIVPAKIEMNGEDWTARWFSAARHDGDINRNASNPKGAFDDAFPDLALLTKDMKSQNFGDLVKTLAEAQSNAGSDITVLGLALPYSFIKLLGVVVVLITQCFATLHLIEVRNRMSAVPNGDPGAAEAWVMIYDSGPARIASLLIIGLPALTSAIVAYRLSAYANDQSGAFEIFLFLGGTCLSIYVSIYSILLTSKLRKTAREHRNTINDNHLTEKMIAETQR